MAQVRTARSALPHPATTPAAHSAPSQPPPTHTHSLLGTTCSHARLTLTLTLTLTRYYIQPDAAEYEKALELTCTPAEEAAVEDAKQENSRVQWLEYFVAEGKLSQARQLGWD